MDRTRQLVTGSLVAAACAGVALWHDHAPPQVVSVAASRQPVTAAAPTTAVPPSFDHGSFSTLPQPLDLRGVNVQPLPNSRQSATAAAAFGWSGKRNGGTYPPNGAADLPTGSVQAPIVELPEQITNPTATPALPSATLPSYWEPAESPNPLDLSAPHTSVTKSTEEMESTAEVVGPRLSSDDTDPIESARPKLNPLDVPAPITQLPSQQANQQSAIIEAAQSQSASMCQEGRRLAERGALFSARSEFLMALRTLAAAYDQTVGGQSHLQAFTNALHAMDEAGDFEVSLDVTKLPDIAHLAAGHRTKLLTEQELTYLSAAEARDRYLAYAVQQITQAVATDSAATKALFGLGRVAAAEAKLGGSRGLQNTSVALVWYHAAMNVDPQHFHAAHELGTLYAQRGDWPAARTVLQRAVTLGSHPHTWRNLAAVHHKLGEDEWAIAAQTRAGKPSDRDAIAANMPAIEWVDPETFAKSQSASEAQIANEHNHQSQPPKSATKPSTPDASQDRTAKKSGAGKWFPWQR